MGTLGSFRVSGWPAVAVLVVVFAFPAVSVMKHMQPVTVEERESVRAWLRDDYAQPNRHHHLVGFGPLATSARGTPQLEVSPPAETREDTAQVTIASIEAHGWKDFVIARTKLTAQFPEGAPVEAERYLYVQRNRDATWRVVSESDAAHYWMVLVPAPRNGSSWP